MGICFECLVTIDGESDRQACLEPVRDGMRVDRVVGTELERDLGFGGLSQLMGSSTDEVALDKRFLPSNVRERQEKLFTEAWRRLQEVADSPVPVDEYPLALED